MAERKILSLNGIFRYAVAFFYNYFPFNTYLNLIHLDITLHIQTHPTCYQK